MSLVSDITTICNNLYPSATFILASQLKAGLEAYSKTLSQFPIIILDNELPSDEEIQPNAMIKADHRIVLTFLQKDEFDATDADSETIVEQMRGYARRVFVNLYQLAKIRLKTGKLQRYKLTPVFKISNSILTGVIGTIDLSEDIVTNWCST